MSSFQLLAFLIRRRSWRWVEKWPFARPAGSFRALFFRVTEGFRNLCSSTLKRKRRACVYSFSRFTNKYIYHAEPKFAQKGGLCHVFVYLFIVPMHFASMQCTEPSDPLWPMRMAVWPWLTPQAAQLLQLRLGEELISVHRSVVPWPETSASCSIPQTWLHSWTPQDGSLVSRCSMFSGWMGARFGCVLVATLNTWMHRCWHQMNCCLRPYPKARSGKLQTVGLLVCWSWVKYWANFLSNPKLWQSLKRA